MAGNNGATLRQVRRLFDEGTVAGLPEAQLLERFLARRDEVAFEALVARHGPMVLGVCRRILRDPHAVEDAFQATFLVFVRKARSVRDRELLGPWLYGVAYRVALRSRATSNRRSSREQPYTEATIESDDGFGSDVRPVIDEELARLPERYRAPLVLCYLEGQTHHEAAERLRCPVGTVRSRLARGRDKLRSRLIRRGLAPAALGFITAGNWAKETSAAVSPALLQSTAEAATRFAAGQLVAAGVVSAPAAALTQGVLATMFLSKLKIGVIGLLTFVLIGGGARMLSTRGLTAAQVSDGDGKEEPKALQSSSEGDLKQLQGLWWITEAEPKQVLDQAWDTYTWRFQNSTLWTTMVRHGDGRLPVREAYAIRLDETTTPKRLSMTIAGPAPDKKTLVNEGIYQLKGDHLRIAIGKQGEPAPREFSAKTGQILLVLNRPPTSTRPSPTPKVAKPGDLLRIEVLEALPGRPITGERKVRSDSLPAGWPRSPRGRPITGERKVRSDGTISLGYYGDLKVAGMTRGEIKVAVVKRLRETINDDVLGLEIPDAQGNLVPVDPADSNRVFVDDEIDAPLIAHDDRLAKIEQKLNGLARQLGAYKSGPKAEETAPADREARKAEEGAPPPAPLRGLEIRLKRAQRMAAVFEKLHAENAVSLKLVEDARAAVDVVVEEIETLGETLTDELELLAVQRLKKEAELRGTEAQLTPTKVRLTELANPPGFKHGEVRENLVFTEPVRSMPEFKNLIAEKAMEEAQRDVKAAELREVEVRIKQARRRLDQIGRLKKLVEPTADAPPKQ